MKVSESEARSLLKALGFNVAVIDAMSVDRLRTKVEDLPNKEASLKKLKGENGKLLDRVMSALEVDEDIFVIPVKDGKKAAAVAVGKKGGKKVADDDDGDDEDSQLEDEEEEDDGEEAEDEGDVDDTEEEEVEDDGDEKESDDDTEEEDDGKKAPAFVAGDTVKFVYKKKPYEGTVVEVDEENSLYAVKVEERASPMYVGFDDETLTLGKKPKGGKKPASKPEPEEDEEDDDDSELDTTDDEEEDSEDEEFEEEEESEESEDDDEDETTDSDLESEEDEDDMEETTTKKPATKKPNGKTAAKPEKNGKPAAKKGSAFQSAGKSGKPGVIESMIEFLTAASEQRPITKPEIVAKLCKRFPDKPETAIKSTTGTYLPYGLLKKKNVKVSKNANGYWIKKGKSK